MSKKKDLHKIIEEVSNKDKRYKIDAYIFVLTALNQVVECLDKKRHITGKELSEGIGKMAMQEYGPMARTVLEHWGVKTTDDFGNIVFNLISVKVLGKTEADSISDFKNIFDFKKVFEDDYKYDK